MRRWIGLIGVALLGTAAPGLLRAQQDTRLAEAIALARDGRADSARTMVDHLLQAIPPTDSLYPEALYTAGSIAGSAQEMQRFFQRVWIEYAWSGWADDALLRLAQIDYAAHDAAATARTLETLRQDYPDTPLLPTAALWAARAYFDLNDAAAACGWLAQGLDASGADVELQNRLRYYQSRCGAQADSVPTAEAPRVEPTPGGGFWVQTLATRTRDAAQQAAQRLTALGHATQVVAEDGWFKVRVGAFPDRAGAEQAVQRVKQQVGGNPFIVHHP